MKNFIQILCLAFCLSSCNTPKEVPYLVGREDFTISKIKMEAHYKSKNLNEGITFTNLPENLRDSHKSDKDWDILIEKYGAEVKYGINKVNDNEYIIRWLTKWPEHTETSIKTPEGFFAYLKKNGITDYKVVKQDHWEGDDPHFVILILYQGVKNDLVIRPKTISARAYLLEDKDYWESQGQFMLDTPVEVFEKKKYKTQ